MKKRTEQELIDYREYQGIKQSEKYYREVIKREAPKFREYIRELLTLTGMTSEQITEYEIEKQKQIKRDYQQRWLDKKEKNK